jgi:DHA1 family inner membrane transport protein
MYLVANAGVTETQLPLVFVTGGLLTLVGAPLIGRLADRYGKLPVYRVVTAIAMCLILVVTNLPHVPLALAVGAVGSFMLSNAGRMVAALAMVTGSVERRLRGGFMSANSAVQHLASGVGASIGGLILTKSDDGTLHRFYLVGLFALVATALSLWVAGRVRLAQEPEPASIDHPTFSPEVETTKLDYPADHFGVEPS